LEKVTILMRW